MKFRNPCAASLVLATLSVAGAPQAARAQSCPTVDIERELMIVDLGVVNDAERTTGDGVWTFKHLMESMAPSSAEAASVVEAMFSTWSEDRDINGFVVPERDEVASLVLDGWPRDASGALDLSQAPLRLLAIVNRLDLRNLNEGQAGEGRFVFGVLDAGGNAQQFTLILEYRLPATSEAEVLEWANLWHGLNGLAPGSDDYNTLLSQITERFAGRDADPGGINGSALNQLRTNELLDFRQRDWELREFRLAADGSLAPDTVKLTPDTSLDGGAAVSAFVNQNEAEILIERHDVPETFGGAPFLAGSSINPVNFFWQRGDITNNEARHKLSLNTCNGCHGGETGTPFLHIFPRDADAPAALSAFLTGGAVADPVDPTQLREFDDLGRRQADMSSVLCTPTEGLVRRDANELLSVGIGRVH